MTQAELKAQIDTDITNKVAASSITPGNAGSNMKAICDELTKSLGENFDTQSPGGTGEAIIYSQTIPAANMFRNGDQLVVQAAIKFANDHGGFVTYRLGGVDLFSSNVDQTIGDDNDKEYSVELRIIKTSNNSARILYRRFDDIVGNFGSQLNSFMQDVSGLDFNVTNDFEIAVNQDETVDATQLPEGTWFSILSIKSAE